MFILTMPIAAWRSVCQQRQRLNQRPVCSCYDSAEHCEQQRYKACRTRTVGSSTAPLAMVMNAGSSAPPASRTGKYRWCFLITIARISLRSFHTADYPCLYRLWKEHVPVALKWRATQHAPSHVAITDPSHIWRDMKSTREVGGVVAGSQALTQVLAGCGPG